MTRTCWALAAVAGWIAATSLVAAQEEKKPELLQTFKRANPIEDELYGVALAPDGKSVAATGKDGSVTLWDVKAGTELVLKKANDQKPDSVSSTMEPVLFTPDGKQVVAGGAGEGLFLWSSTTGKLAAKKPFYYSTGNMALSPDGATLVVGCSSSYTVHRRDSLTELGTLDYDITGLKGWKMPTTIFPVAYMPDGKKFAAGNAIQGIRLWDAKTLKEVKKYPSPNASHVRSIAFSRSGKTFAVCGDDAEIRIWDTQTGKVLKTLTSQDPPVMNVIFHPTRDVLYSSDSGGTVRCWNPTSGEELWKIDGENGGGRMISISADGSLLACAFTEVTLLSLPPPLPQEKK